MAVPIYVGAAFFVSFFVSDAFAWLIFSEFTAEELKKWPDVRVYAETGLRNQAGVLSVVPMEKDVEEISKEIKSGVEIIFVEKMSEVIEHAFA